MIKHFIRQTQQDAIKKPQNRLVKKKKDACIIYVTYPTIETARECAKNLVYKRAAAGVNIFGPGYSLYHWQKEIREKEEYCLFAQTCLSSFSICKKIILASHPYKVPCIISLPVIKGSKNFLSWICHETGKEKCK